MQQALINTSSINRNSYIVSVTLNVLFYFDYTAPQDYIHIKLWESSEKVQKEFVTQN